MYNYPEVFVIALLTSVALTPIIRLFAFKLGMLDHPKDHGIHSHPVPNIGGVAIYIAFVVGALWKMELSEMLKGVLVGATLIMLIGIVDDRFHVRAGYKLVIQFLACALMMFKYGVILDVFPNIFMNAFFTTLGIIGLTNAINFIDNMDGLASGIVMISSVTIFIIAASSRQIWLAFISLALVGATSGFLIFNFKKAYVFMGDSGSTFLGFTLASFCIMAEWSYFLPVTLAVPTLILGVPIIDMILITVLRIKENKVKNIREWIDYTGKDHFSHRLMRLGLSERGAVISLWLLQTVFCAIALMILPHQNLHGFLGIGFFVLVILSVLIYFRKRRYFALASKGRFPKRESVTVSR